MQEIELEVQEKGPVGKSNGEAAKDEKEKLVDEKDKEGKDKEGKEKGGKDEKEKKELPMTAFFTMFRYVTAWDTLLMIIGALGSIVAGLAFPAFSIVFGNILNEISGDPDNIVSAVTFYSYVFLVIGGAVFVGAWSGLGIWMYIGERQTKKYREEFLQAILRQEMGWFDNHTPGELNTTLVVDTKAIGRAVGEKTATFFQHSSTFIGGLVVGFVKGWQLALLVLGITPLVGVSAAIMAKAMGSYSNLNQSAYADAGSVADEAISNIRTVQAFSGEPKESNRYCSHLGKARIAGVKKSIFQGASIGVTNFVFYAAFGLAFWFGTWLIQNEQINNWSGKPWTGGDVMAVFFAVLIGAFSLGNLGPCFEAFASGRSACYRLLQVIDRVPSIDALSTEGAKPARFQGEIEFKNISFKYPTRPEYPIFEGFNLTVKPGQNIALVGESGSGKSTVVGLVERFYDPDQGTVLIDGADLKTLNLEWWRKHVAIVSQEPTLFDGSVADNIRFGKPDATDAEVEEAAKIANAHDFIQTLPEKYKTVVGQDGGLMSGGQKQRIAIARAVIQNPVVLLLDEATSALDNTSERLVQAALEKVMKNRTTIVIAHRLTTIQNADVIHVVNRGKIMETGTHRELMDKGEMYYGLVQSQQMHDKEQEQKGEAEKVEEKADTTLVRAPSDKIALKRHSSAKSETKEEAEKLLQEEEKEKEPVKPVMMTRILAMAIPNWHWFIIGMIGAAISGVAQPVWAIIFGEITEVMYQPGPDQSKKAGFWAGMFVLIGTVLGLGNVWQEWGFGVVGERLTESIRRKTFEAVLRNEIGWFDEKSHGTRVLTTRLNVDASLVQEGTTKRFGQMMFALSCLLGGLIIAFTESPKLAAVTLATLPAVVIGAALETKFMTGFSKDEQKAYERAGTCSGEALAAIKTVHSFNAAKRVISRYGQLLDIPLKLGVKTANASGLGYGFSQCVMYGIHALCWWYGAKLVAEGEITIGSMLAAVFAIVMCGYGLGQAAEMVPNLQKASFAKDNVFHLIDRKPLIDASSPDGTKTRLTEGEVVFKDIDFCYPIRPERQILHGMSAHVRSGETVALVGPSGCGKSTIMSLLLRFYDPAKGTITIDGVQTNTMNINALRRQIGIVSQEPRLFDASIKENILYGNPDATEEEIVAACKAANIYDWISTQPDKLETQCGVRGGKLSGGQKQRVAIARALVRNPKILLLDEATSALDSESEKVVQAALDELVESKSRTTIVIAHRLSTIQKADRIFVFDHGRVVEEGNHDSLLAKDGLYASLVRAGGGKKDS